MSDILLALLMRNQFSCSSKCQKALKKRAKINVFVMHIMYNSSQRHAGLSRIEQIDFYAVLFVSNTE